MLKNPLIQVGKALSYCCLAALICIGLQRFCYKKTDGFALYKVLSSLTPDPRWDLPALSSEEKGDLESLFDQPFYYLGKGAQAYVFASQDGSAVIKFCRFDHLRPPLLFAHCIFPFIYEKSRIERMVHKRGRLEQEFGSYKIAFEEMKQQTGLIYLHLNKGSLWNKVITIYDKIGVAHKLPLDQMEFIIQKKATLVYPTISHLMETGADLAAQKAITRLVNLLKERCAKGIFDKDPDLITNFGFLDEQPLQIDIGRFLWRDHPPQETEIREEILRITDPFKRWLQQEHPTLAPYLIQEIEASRA